MLERLYHRGFCNLIDDKCQLIEDRLASRGRWVHVAKVAFEKYFLRKVRTGNTEPYYEKAVMKFLDIGKIKRRAA